MEKQKNSQIYSAKIVIVDDSKDITDCLSVLLKFENFTDINTFDNPNDALNFLENNKPDIVIADFMLPEMSGLDFFDKVNEMYHRVFKILIGAYVSEEDLQRAINETGIDKYFDKPWNNDELIDCIKNGIEKQLVKKQQ